MLGITQNENDPTAGLPYSTAVIEGVLRNDNDVGEKFSLDGHTIVATSKRVTEGFVYKMVVDGKATTFYEDFWGD
ncbi:hypothetical protein D7S89_20290 [Trinickia fusca]|uniref:Uncharacterized protein n=2 Tax=Trinickia fusca TaxID=2419777 RepID=A0A494X3A3_9BURK|nr:hypothetical protein D7S89_20290 [Trinickia fusca]